MKPKILTIQFRKNESSIAQEQASILREVGDEVSVEFVSALDDSIDWNFPETVMEQYSGLILGGSAEFTFDSGRDEEDEGKRISYELLGKLRPLFTYVFDHDIPTLGVCYGHQILGAFAGAQVKYDELQKKTRSHEVKLLVDQHDYFLFSDLPPSFQAHYGHKNVLDRVPEGAVLLMQGGEECKVSALRYKNNIYTTQFHPELRPEDILERVKNSPGYLPEGVVAEEIFKDDPNSNKILQNFSKLVVAHAVQSTTASARV